MLSETSTASCQASTYNIYVASVAVLCRLYSALLLSNILDVDVK